MVQGKPVRDYGDGQGYPKVINNIFGKDAIAG